MKFLSLLELCVSQSYFYELIINLMVSSGKFHQLSELFQYNLIADFQKIAGYLLSLQPYYEPAYQLALDMYKVKAS